MSKSGGNVASVVVDDVVELVVCLLLFGLAKPATATESFAPDLNSLASTGDSDFAKAPAVDNKNV